MATASQQIANGRQEQINAQLAQAASIAVPPTPPTATPFPSNDDWLAARVKEVRDSSAEYAKLQTEEARQQWEGLVRQNALREQSLAQERQDKVTRYNSDNEAHDQRERQTLDAHWAELLNTAKPGEHAWNMPPERLRDIAALAQKTGQYVPQEQIDALNATLDPLYQTQQLAQERNPQLSHPDTFPDGSLDQVKDNGDGTLEAKLITGEVFRGDPLTVTRKIGEANVHTKRWAREQRTQPVPQPQQQNPNSAVTFDANGQPVVDFAKIPDVTQWQMNQFAVSLGYKDGQEMVQDQIAQRQTTQQLQQRLREREERDFMTETSTSFLANAPDFPNTDESIAAIEQVIAVGLEYAEHDGGSRAGDSTGTLQAVEPGGTARHYGDRTQDPAAQCPANTTISQS
jgi:hypothetical protein